jgi:hypothetical protein
MNIGAATAPVAATAAAFKKLLRVTEFFVVACG